jgi:hypothetical protein
VEDAIPVHMIYCFKELEHIVFDPVLWQVVATSLYRIVEVHVHQLEDKGQATCRLIIQNLIELNYLRMGA